MLFKGVYISSILFFLGFNCFSQDSLILHIKSINNNEPIENAAVINQANKAFGYTNSEGTYDLTDFNLKDSLIVVIPGYESYRSVVSKIVKENGIIHLVPKFEQLDEVILLGKDENIYSCQYNIIPDQRKNTIPV